MAREKLKYYRVLAKCGHVGRKNYIPIAFAVKAKNGRDAASKVRNFPRVKHQHKDAILDVQEINYEEYLALKKVNDNDDYLKCHSKKQQNTMCDLKDRLYIDEHNAKIEYDKNERKSRVAYKLKKYREMLKCEWAVEYDYIY